MAESNATSKASSGSNSYSSRSAKSAVTRKITADKRSKLSERNDYAYRKAVSLRNAAEAMADHILNGGDASGELLQAMAAVEAQLGVCLFQ